MTDPLERELKIYQSLLPTLLSQVEGKYALIYGDDLVGTFETYEDALAIGYEKCGVKPFLVKKVSSTERIAFFSRDIIHATSDDSTYQKRSDH